jgi:uncharacterized protein YsxB (DUF464 family)
MIRIVLERDSDGTIQTFTMRGHAQYDNPGRDIVCAGASAIAFGTLNALEALLGIIPETEADEKQGYLKVMLPDRLSVEQQAQVQLLLEAMLISLRTIEQSYGKYISIQDLNRKGG